MSALGLIETKGLVAAIEGADAMLKAANVRLLEKNLVGGGLVTITISGEVSAVKASIDAAVVAIKRIEGAVLVSEHVIARPDVELARILALTPPQNGAATHAQKAPSSFAKTEKVAANTEENAVVVPTANAQAITVKSGAKTSAKADIVRHEISQLKKMNVNKLRQIARNLSGLSMTTEEVELANKKDLIEAIVNVYRQIEE